MYCPKCGEKLNGDEKFCPVCGTEIDLDEEESKDEIVEVEDNAVEEPEKAVVEYKNPIKPLLSFIFAVYALLELFSGFILYYFLSALQQIDVEETDEIFNLLGGPVSLIKSAIIGDLPLVILAFIFSFGRNAKVKRVFKILGLIGFILSIILIVVILLLLVFFVN